ncbi:MAG: response regulator [Lachnospiraceae bacterium]|nr:response regulator [Lachnospiraceae bacterium]
MKILRIVIVDNEQRARRRLKTLIYSIDEDYEVAAEASDGAKGLELIEIIKPDVVFTDIKLPFMSGLSLIKTAQAMNNKIQYVIISAYEEFGYAKQAIALGVQDYLVKPVTYEEVRNVLKQLRGKLKGDSIEENEDLNLLYPNAHPLVLKALKIIENGYNARLNQKMIAEKLGLTKEYFSYLFHRDMGKTFTTYLKEYRINIAKRLLSTEVISKGEIPYQVGFTDPKYFNKVFRETTGETVTEYRRRKQLS